MPEENSCFWNFSLAVYSDVAVQQECLKLQDRYGINVNLLLFCAFVGAAHGALLSQADVKQAEDLVRNWHTGVVERLRAARRAVKPSSQGASPIGFETFYDSIKERELEAERLEQAMLERWCALHLSAWSGAQPSAAVEKNLAALFAVCLEGREGPALPDNLIAAALRYVATLHQRAKF